MPWRLALGLVASTPNALINQKKEKKRKKLRNPNQALAMAPGSGSGSLCPNALTNHKKEKKNYKIRRRRLPWRLSLAMEAFAPHGPNRGKRKNKTEVGAWLKAWRSLPLWAKSGKKLKCQ